MKYHNHLTHSLHERINRRQLLFNNWNGKHTFARSVIWAW